MARVNVRRRRTAPAWLLALIVLTLPSWLVAAGIQSSSPPLPELNEPVNDFAHVVDAASARELDRVIRALKAATGDVIVVATVPTIAPYADIREYAVKLFENDGRGIGDKGKDNGILILLAEKERRVGSEVGYGREQWTTDGYAGEESRRFIVREVRNGR